ncbi:9479_t:CDS:1, partial [Dentiscutata heterogama]
INPIELYNCFMNTALTQIPNSHVAKGPNSLVKRRQSSKILTHFL